MNHDLNQAARDADRDYRAAEAKKAAGVDLPYLVTLNFRTSAEAHRLIEWIKHYGGVVVELDPTDGAPEIVHAGVMDFREWGGESEIFGPKWPNHPNRPEV